MLEDPTLVLVGLERQLVAVEVEPDEVDAVRPRDLPGVPGHREAPLEVGELAVGLDEAGVDHRHGPVARVVDEQPLARPPPGWRRGPTPGAARIVSIIVSASAATRPSISSTSRGRLPQAPGRRRCGSRARSRSRVPALTFREDRRRRAPASGRAGPRRARRTARACVSATARNTSRSTGTSTCRARSAVASCLRSLAAAGRDARRAAASESDASQLRFVARRRAAGSPRTAARTARWSGWRVWTSTWPGASRSPRARRAGPRGRSRAVPRASRGRAARTGSRRGPRSTRAARGAPGRAPPRSRRRRGRPRAPRRSPPTPRPPRRRSSAATRVVSDEMPSRTARSAGRAAGDADPRVPVQPWAQPSPPSASCSGEAVRLADRERPAATGTASSRAAAEALEHDDHPDPVAGLVERAVRLARRAPR